jgi:hypothetical protein
MRPGNREALLAAEFEEQRLIGEQVFEQGCMQMSLGHQGSERAGRDAR